MSFNTTTDTATDPTAAPPACTTAAAHPPRTARDLRLDLLRAAALAVVVVWHWVFTSVHWSEAGPHTDNPVATVDWLWVLTWVAQPMCVFFAVGGALHAKDRRRPTAFYTARLRRLLPPVLPVVAAAGVLVALAHTTGNDSLVRSTVLAVSPMWFLGVYLVLIALAPAARWAHARAGALVPAVLLTAVAVADTWRLSTGADHLAVELTMLVLTWAFVHQLGFHLTALFANRRASLALGATGLVALCALAATSRYPAAMVGSSGSHLSNMGPPNLMAASLAMFQLGALGALAGPLKRTAHRLRHRLAAVNRHSMQVFTWHMVAFVVFAHLARHLSVDNALDAPHWWATRPLWLAGPLGLYLAGTLVARHLRRSDRRRGTRPRRHLRAAHARRHHPALPGPVTGLNDQLRGTSV